MSKFYTRMAVGVNLGLDAGQQRHTVDKTARSMKAVFETWLSASSRIFTLLVRTKAIEYHTRLSESEKENPRVSDVV